MTECESKNKDKIMNKALYIVVFFLFSFAMAAEGGKVGMAFLKIGVDARAAAMGNAYTALANDAGASYWNPAGLALAEDHSILFMHNAWLLDINHEFVAAQLLRGKHNLALSVNMIAVPDIEIRQGPSEKPDGTSTATNLYISGAYARQIADNWMVGVQLKYLTEKYYMIQAQGIAVDLGVIRKNLIQNLTVGATVQNLGKMEKLREMATELPIVGRLGAAYILPYKVMEYNPVVSLDVVHVYQDVTQMHIGSEIPLGAHLDLRLGYVLGSDSYSFTTGAGVAFDRYRFGYAFVPYKYELGNTHRMSLMILF
jgi:hypothetical protein